MLALVPYLDEGQAVTARCALAGIYVAPVEQ